MKLKICRVPDGNFGDDLNDLLWPELFPNILELRNDIELYGIGTILGSSEQNADAKTVLGSGLGYKKMNPLGKQWDIRWVRGQLSAKALGIDERFALGDGALLWPELNTKNNAGRAIGFIPHHATWETYDWSSIAEAAGLKAINPKDSPMQVASQIKTCSRVITESLHGAIFADCLQVPWHSVVLSYRFNNFKWKDWLSIYNLPFKPSVAPTALSHGIGRLKAVKNLCARTFLQDNDIRYNSLRIVGFCSESDRQAVIDLLGKISTDDSLFTCSTAASMDIMRNKLHNACKKFAIDYDLAFTM